MKSLGQVILSTCSRKDCLIITTNIPNRSSENRFCKELRKDDAAQDRNSVALIGAEKLWKEFVVDKVPARRFVNIRVV